MRHLKVIWRHNFPDEPVDLYSEIDDAGFEIRKVEIYRDGHLDFADCETSSGSTSLGEGPLPSLEEIAEQEDFFPSFIEAVDFERIWRRAVAGSSK